MDYTLLISNERVWHKDCGRIGRRDLDQIYSRVQELSHRPWPEAIDVKKLQHYDVADYRLRVGDYRVLFNVHDDRREVRLLRVLHRSKLY